MIGIFVLAAAGMLQPAATAKPTTPTAAKPAETELWVLDQISFPITQTPADAATMKAIEPDHTMEAVATRLALLGVKFERNIVTVDVGKMTDLVAQVQKLSPTEPFAISGSGRVTINVILSKRRGPAAPGTPAPRPAVPSSPAAVASIDRLLDLMDVASQFDSQVSRMVDAVMTTVKVGGKEQTDEARKIIGEELRASFLKSRPLLLAQARELYLARFNAAELGQLITFYESPLGRKMTSMVPGITAAMAQFGLQLGRAVTLDAQPRIDARLRAANIKPVQGV